ncbi:proprotein convertase subtilisin/kexin type 5-like [Ptychodera flava]|uniref:proprotein convertase subtilisin/kexin type 5-like n=1 Tax=Ptychodera flava TaxID=63121 RepID=UPI003969D906
MSASVKLCMVTLCTSLYVVFTSAAIYTNQYAVHLQGGLSEADRLAAKYGYINLGQVGTLEDHYLFVHRKVTKRSLRPNQGKHTYIHKEPGVHWIEQQAAKSRVKRDYKPTFTDPNWKTEQWYFNRENDLTMNIAEAWNLGYTGKGVVVTILDDGIEHDHPDLKVNYDPEASTDINNHDRDPMPRTTFNDENRHGTRCAGEVAMQANNSACGVGAAFNAGIGGIRMLDGMVTDAVEAESLSFNPEHVDIYSASWGPDDDGKTVDGPGRMAKQAFIEGVTKGRNGKGSIFMWASGNGGRGDDNCNCDGYQDSIYTISISSTTERSLKPWYSEECSSTLATTYSSGSVERGDKEISTTDLHHRCTARHTGTSASAPLAAGMIALVLEANPDLTWRDVQHIIVRTSRKFLPKNPEGESNDWVTNGAGYDVSHKYGFGLLDGGEMVKLAKVWKTAPKQHACQSAADQTPRRTPATATMKTDGCEGSTNQITYLEHVQVKISATLSRRGDLAIYLTSPSGTKSDLLKPRRNDHTSQGLTDWVFMTTHCWGEKASGTWTLEVASEGSSFSEGVLQEWTLILYGTSEPVNPKLITVSSKPSVSEPTKVKENTKPFIKYSDGKFENGSKHAQIRAQDEDEDDWDEWSDSDYSYYDDCDPQCLDGCDGPTAKDCWTCKNYKDRISLDCVENCPEGFYAPDLHHRCRYCDYSCASCNGPTSYDCLSCPDGRFLVEDTSECVKSCQQRPGYFADEERQMCSACNRLCDTCVDSADHCLTCKDGAELQGDRCVVGCPPQTYKDEYDVCQRCHESCLSCFGPSDDDCLDCQPYYILQDRKCLRGESCGDGYYRDTEVYPAECRSCHESCKSCSGPGEDECLDCGENLHFHQGRCQSTCSEGQFLDYDVCTDCYEGCNACNGSAANQCLNCVSGRFLQGSKCVEECISGTYGYNGECHACNPSCSQCQGGDATDCLVCAQPDDGHRYLLEGMCIEHCYTGYYGNDDILQCLPCHDSCWSCFGPRDDDCDSCLIGEPDEDGRCNADCDDRCKTCISGYKEECTSCYDGYFLWDHKCLNSGSCPPGTFHDFDHNECHPCHPTCSLCDERYHDNCLSCEENYYLTPDGTCESECPIGTYTSDRTNTCEECQQTCASCFGAGHSRCLSCVENRYLDENNCVISCNDGQYADEENRLCIKCHRSCKTCSGPSDYDCLTCDNGFEEYHGRCMSPCSDGQYQGENGECEFCHDSCDTCSGGGQTDCLSCRFTYFLTWEGLCTDHCEDGYFDDYSSGTCQSCHSTCQKCLGSSESDCLTCAQDLFLYEGIRCVEHCPEGFFADVNSECQPCSLDCGDCIDNKDKCVSCRRFTYLFQDESTSRCVDACPTGFREDEDSNSCVAATLICPMFCMDCDEDTGMCTACVRDFTLRNGICYSSADLCREDQFPFWEEGEWKCANCPNYCASCIGPTENDCTSCEMGYKLQGGKCVTKCFYAEYEDTRSGRCEACHASCATCDGPAASDCLSCRLPYHIDEDLGICRSQCPKGKYEDFSSCEECDPSCATCDGPTSEDCLSCVKPQFLQDYTCKVECMAGFYGDHVEDVDGEEVLECRRCHFNCKTCHGPMADECIECEDHLIMRDHECVADCGSGFYVNNGECRACHITCEKCTGPEINKCESCPEGKFLQDGKCGDACGVKYYYDEDKVECLHCHPSCEKCEGQGAQDCTKCNRNDMLQSGVCYPRCLSGNYYSGDDNSTGTDNEITVDCQPCHSTCKECIGPGPKNCYECDQPRVYQKKSHRCMLCCDQNNVENKDEECCNCHPDTGECIMNRSSNTASNIQGGSHKNVVGLVVLLVIAIISVFFIVFGILQCRSKKIWCFNRNYHKLPTYYESNSDEVRMSRDYTDDDVEVYSKDRI